MYYIPELLCRRSRGHLSKCWLAATLNENNFKKICNSRELPLIDINKTCEEIECGMIHQAGSALKFSLYLSAKLMYGISVILFYKAKAAEDYVKNVTQNFCMSMNKKNINEPLKKVEDTINLIDVPEMPDQFLIEALQPDHNIMLENDGYNERLINIMEAENIDDGWEFNRMTSDDAYALMKGPLFEETNDNTTINEHQWGNIDMNIGIFDGDIREPIRAPLIDVNSNNLQSESVLKTPTKRKQHESYLDTPSKRTRKNLMELIDNQEIISPAKIPEASDYSNIVDIPPAIPTHENSITHEIRQSHSLMNDAIQRRELPNDEWPLNISLESLNRSVILPRERKKHRKFFDVKLNISADGMKRQIENIYIMTRPIDAARVNIDRIRLDSQLLFKKPSTACRPKSISNWSNNLYKMYLANTQGPFHNNIDESLFLEYVRFRDTTEKTGELSSDMNKRATSISELTDRNNFTDGTIRMIDNVAHIEVVHESIDIGDTAAVEQPMFDSELVMTIMESQMNTSQSAETVPVRNSIRTSNSSDFLPDNFEKELPPVKQRSLEEENIVDVNSTQFLSRSKSRSSSLNVNNRQTKDKLFIELKNRWNKKEEPIRFNHIFPPGTATKFQTAQGLLDLLYLAKDVLIYLTQEKSYSTIWIQLNFVDDT